MLSHEGNTLAPSMLAQHALAGSCCDPQAFILVGKVVADFLYHLFLGLKADDLFTLLEELPYARHALQQLEDAACSQLKGAQIQAAVEFTCLMIHVKV
jgi:hypothetical protein